MLQSSWMLVVFCATSIVALAVTVRAILSVRLVIRDNQDLLQQLDGRDPPPATGIVPSLCVVDVRAEAARRLLLVAVGLIAVVGLLGVSAMIVGRQRFDELLVQYDRVAGKVAVLESSMGTTEASLRSSLNERTRLMEEIAFAASTLRKMSLSLSDVLRSNSDLQRELTLLQHNAGEVSDLLKSGGTSFDSARTEQRLTSARRNLRAHLQRAMQLAIKCKSDLSFQEEIDTAIDALSENSVE